MSAPPEGSLAAALAGTRALLLDLDGVVVLRGAPIDGAVAALARLDHAGIPFGFATNFSLTSRATMARELGRAGIAVTPGRIVTAASAAAEYCRRRFGGEPLYVLASADALTEFAGLRLVSHEEAAGRDARAAAVVVGDAGDDFTPANLQSAFTLVRAGARLVAMHRTRWWITPEGVRLDVGAYVAALEFATQRRAVVTGKPSRAFFEAGLAILRSAVAGELAATGDVARNAGATGEILLPGDVAMVGDDPWSDLRGAARLGLRTFFVRSGKYGEAELARYSAERDGPPDGAAASLAEIVEAITARVPTGR